MIDDPLTSSDPGVFSGYILTAFTLDKEVWNSVFWYTVLAKYYAEFAAAHERKEEA